MASQIQSPKSQQSVSCNCPNGHPHKWQLPSSDSGRYVTGVCQYCHESRTFRNSYILPEDQSGRRVVPLDMKSSAYWVGENITDVDRIIRGGGFPVYHVAGGRTNFRR